MHRDARSVVACHGVMTIVTSFLRLLPLLAAACVLQACGGSSGGGDQSPAPNAANAQNPGSASGATSGPVAMATNLSAEIFCDPAISNRGLAEFRWTPADPPGQEQRIEITIFKRGFETGAFEESKPVSPDDDVFVFESVQGQAVHRWRVVTVGAAGETVSETARFEGPLCVDDEVVDQPDPIP